MKVYGALEAAQIEWFTNAGKPAASSYPFRVIYVTDLKQIQVSDGTNWNPSALYTYTAGTLPAAGASNQYQVAFITDTLQVKVSNGTEWKTIGARLDTYTSGTIPAAASNTNSIIWVSDLQQVQVSNGTAWVQVGSKAGTKNYFSQNNANADFETNSVSPWSACTLTFSSGVPSGAPTLTATQMAISTTSTTPLSGTYSMLLTKSAANAQYQGFISGALTIDREDTAKVLYGSFYYEVVSGTIDLSGSSTQSLEIWIYNTVSGQWTQPAGYRGMNQSSGVGKVVFSFQTDGTYANNAYKIAIITQQTSTSAFVVEFDDFQVGPQAIVLGNAMTDPVSYTPTLTNAGNATATGAWYRLGSNVVIEATITIGSTLPTGTITISKPSNITPSMAATGLVNTAIVTGSIAASGATYDGALRYDISLGTFSFLGGNGQQFWNATVPATWAAGDKIRISATMQVTGWGSFSQVSSDTDTRVVAAGRTTLSSTTITSGTALAFTTSDYDTHGAFTSTSVYTVPVSGFYRVMVSGLSASSVVNLFVAINGVQTILMGSIGTTRGCTGATVQCNAGQQITVSPGASTTASSTNGHIFIERVSGPSVITATETVAARMYSTAGSSGSGLTLVNFNNISFDTHGMCTTGASTKITVPISGKYRVSAALYFTNPATNNIRYMFLYKEGSEYSLLGQHPNTGTLQAQLTGSDIVELNAGQYIDIRFNNSGGAVQTLSTNGNYTYVTIEKLKQ